MEFHILTISFWQSFNRSLSNFVLPVPGPVAEAFNMFTYLVQPVDKSSRTCLRRISTFGWSDSIAVFTSESPSSWKKEYMNVKKMNSKDNAIKFEFSGSYTGCYFILLNNFKKYSQEISLTRVIKARKCENYKDPTLLISAVLT